MPLLQIPTLDLDRIILTLVPKAVDEDIKLFKDEKQYVDYATQQVRQFLARLPAEYKNVIEHELDKKTRMFANSNCEFGIGFRPGYQVLTSNEGIITAPLFDLSFKIITKKDATKIIESALKQFFLYQSDIEDGTLIAYGFVGEERAVQDVELLRQFLPRKWGIFKRRVEARCDYALGSGEATYTI